jgi:hypothetical protein
MKTLRAKLSAVLLILTVSGGLLVSCNKEDDSPAPTNPTPPGASPGQPGTGLTITAPDTTFTITEKSVVGTVVGTLKATPSTNATLTYKIASQSVSGAISVAASSGKLTVAQAKAFESASNPAITGRYVALTDGASDTASFTVTIVGEDAVAVSATDFTKSIAENSPTDTIIGKVQVTATGGAPTYTIATQSPSGAVSLNAQGEFAIADSSLFDHETHPEVTGTYVATVGTQSDTANFTITVTDVDEKPLVTIAATDFSGTVDENSAVSTVVGSVSATITEGTGTLTYSIVNQSAAGAVSISAVGELSVANAGRFDYETNTQITGKYRASVGNDSDVADFTIAITDVEDRQVTASDITTSIDENSAVGTVIDTVEAVVTHGTGTPTYVILSQSVAGAVSINAVGELTVADASKFDYEVNEQISGTYQASIGNSTTTADFTVSLNDKYSWSAATVFAGSPTTSGFTNDTGNSARFSGPRGMDFDAQGNLYVADRGNYSVRKITPTGAVGTIVSGSASSSSMRGPIDVEVDSNGDVWIADEALLKISKWNANAGLTSQIGGGKANGISIRGSTIFITRDHYVQRGAQMYAGGSGRNSNLPGYMDGSPNQAQFSSPRGIEAGKGDTLFVADYFNNKVRYITSNQDVGTLPGTYFQISDLAIDPAGKLLIVESGNKRIRTIGAAAADSKVVDNLTSPRGIAINSDGDIFVSDGHCIRKISRIEE